MNVSVVIPAHLGSLRFPKKILYKINGLEMIEHVRRRALLSKKVESVFVATPNKEIHELIKSNNGNSILTSKNHTNGTSRVAEAVSKINCSHVIILQGDEPLILPTYIDKMVAAIKNRRNNQYIWNAVAPIIKSKDLNDKSIVKCFINKNKIMFCFRKSPFVMNSSDQKRIVKKILGLIAFERKILKQFANMPKQDIETLESIEQMRLIELDKNITPVGMDKSLPSINIYGDEKAVNKELKLKEQKLIFDKIFKN